jgi:hypothetical protein
MMVLQEYQRKKKKAAWKYITLQRP